MSQWQPESQIVTRPVVDFIVLGGLACDRQVKTIKRAPQPLFLSTAIHSSSLQSEGGSNNDALLWEALTQSPRAYSSWGSFSRRILSGRNCRNSVTNLEWRFPPLSVSEDRSQPVYKESSLRKLVSSTILEDAHNSKSHTIRAHSTYWHIPCAKAAAECEGVSIVGSKGERTRFN